MYEEVNFEDRNEIDVHLRELNELGIWEGEDEVVNGIIYEAMLRWIDVLRKEDGEAGGEE